MLRAGALLGASAVMASALEATEAAAQPTPAAGGPGVADFIFLNGAIYTVDARRPWAEAVAVQGKRIVHVGDAAGAVKLAGSQTKIVDLKGRMLLPGFVEGHIHPIVGSTVTRGVDLQYDTRNELMAVLRAYAATSSGSGPIRGFGWRYSAFPPSGPRKEDLDAIWPDRPVLLVAIDGHSAWVNSKALALAGVTKDTPDPIPGFSIFKRDASGEATGFLVEVPALVKVLMAAAPVTLDFIKESLAEWLPKASAVGITSVFDVGMQIVPEEVGFGLYADLEQRGKLPFRVVGSYYHNNPAIDPVPLIQDLRRKVHTELVRASVLKLNMDGVDASYTAAMLAPYSDKPDTSGETILSAKLVKDIVRRADADGIDIHVHSIGDRAARWTLDAIEAAIEANPARDRRHTIAHLQGVSPQDIPRFAKLGVLAEFSAQWAVPDVYWREVTTSRWGKERSDRTYLIGSMLKEGVRVSLGTDWPAASNYSTFRPLEAIEIATSRREFDKPDQAPLPPIDERIGLADAIRANTLGAAHQIRLEDAVGSIEVGKLADLVILERNLFEVPPQQIHHTGIVMTMMNGVVRHGTTG